MKQEELNEQLKLEIQHIFDSGANELRIEDMINNHIKRYYLLKQDVDTLDVDTLDVVIGRLTRENLKLQQEILHLKDDMSKTFNKDWVALAIINAGYDPDIHTFTKVWDEILLMAKSHKNWKHNNPDEKLYTKQEIIKNIEEAINNFVSFEDVTFNDIIDEINNKF